MGETSQIIWGLIFSLFGAAFFIYGKRQGAIVPLFTGIALCVFPYFVPNVYAMVTIGTILIFFPYFVRL